MCIPVYLKQWKQLILLRNVVKKINWQTTKDTLWQTVEQAWNHDFDNRLVHFMLIQMKK